MAPSHGEAALIRSEPFTLPRVVVARLAAEVYVRKLWFLLVPWVIIGGLMMTLSTDSRMKAIGMLLAFWPFTIPARAYFVTRRASSAFAKPIWVSIDGDYVLFHKEDGTGFKLSIPRISSVMELHGFFVIFVGYAKILFIPTGAFSDADRDRFRAAITRG